jgi:hypothetical protein
MNERMGFNADHAGAGCLPDELRRIHTWYERAESASAM